MSMLNLTLPEGEYVTMGKHITFEAPCDSNNIEGVIAEGIVYELVDALGNTIPNDSFVKGALVSIILNTNIKKAFVQNPAIKGIEKVEQTTFSTEDGGVNVLTVTLTDGTQSTFQVRNGGSTNSSEDESALELKQDAWVDTLGTSNEGKEYTLEVDKQYLLIPTDKYQEGDVFIYVVGYDNDGNFAGEGSFLVDLSLYEAGSKIKFRVLSGTNKLSENKVEVQYELDGVLNKGIVDMVSWVTDIDTFEIHSITVLLKGATALQSFEDYIKGYIENSTGIESTEINADNELVITYKDGNSVNLGRVVGADGVGIESIEQTTTSTQSGGVNVITITLTDGSKSTFQVKNGESGDSTNGSDGKIYYDIENKVDSTYGEVYSLEVGKQYVFKTTDDFELDDLVIRAVGFKNGVQVGDIGEIAVPLAAYYDGTTLDSIGGECTLKITGDYEKWAENAVSFTLEIDGNKVDTGGEYGNFSRGIMIFPNTDTTSEFDVDNVWISEVLVLRRGAEVSRPVDIKTYVDTSVDSKQDKWVDSVSIGGISYNLYADREYLITIVNLPRVGSPLLSITLSAETEEGDIMAQLFSIPSEGYSVGDSVTFKFSDSFSVSEKSVELYYTLNGVEFSEVLTFPAKVERLWEPIFSCRTDVAKVKQLIESHIISKVKSMLFGVSYFIEPTDWSDNKYTLPYAVGVRSTNTVIVSPAPDSYTEWVDCRVYCTAQGEKTLDFACTTVPTKTIEVNVLAIDN